MSSDASVSEEENSESGDAQELLVLSDIHVGKVHGRLSSIRQFFQRKDGGPNYERCTEIVETILGNNTYKPKKTDILLLGDITEHGRAEEYDKATEALYPLKEAGFTVHMVPGNHDYGTHGNIYQEEAHTNFLSFASQFSDKNYYPKKVEYDGWKLLLVDSTAHQGRGSTFARGRIGTNQLAWLKAEVMEQKKAVVALHHHPFDRNLFLKMSDADQFKDAVDRARVSVVFGHRHEFQRFKGLTRWDATGVALGKCTSDEVKNVFPGIVFDPINQRIVSGPKQWLKATPKKPSP